MDGLNRHIANKINRLLESFPAVVITGARQVGKSTLAQQIKPDWAYFDLENPNTANRLRDDPVLFFREHPEHIILDEAQQIPKLFETLRGVIDQNRAEKGRFIITGSASFELLHYISESLAGRVALVELSPLKMTERLSLPLSSLYQLFEQPLSQAQINFLLSLESDVAFAEIKRQLWLGGYPEPTLADNSGFYLDWMENYFNTYINRDMRTLYPRLDLLKYRRVVQMLSSLSGTIVNRSEIARSVESSEKTIRDYLEIIGGTYFWRSLPAFTSSKIKTTLKLPKGHFTDNGLTLFLNNVLSPNQLETYPRLGNVFESFVAEELIRGIQCTGARNVQLFHFRTKAGGEIDLVVQGSFGLLPIEIKYQSNTRKRSVSSMQNFIELHDLPLGIVVNQCESPSLVTDKIVQVPASCV